MKWSESEVKWGGVGWSEVKVEGRESEVEGSESEVE